MDEQAGPGVFFSNNNSGLPGGGNIKAPLTGEFVGGEAARTHYNIPGILHFLQHEWARFEVERAQWEVERAELQVSSRSHGALAVGQFCLLAKLQSQTAPLNRVRKRAN